LGLDNEAYRLKTGPGESERSTRQSRIDPRLEAAGWKITAFRPGLDLERLSNHAVTEYPTENGPADYALVVGGQLTVSSACHNGSVGFAQSPAA